MRLTGLVSALLAVGLAAGCDDKSSTKAGSTDEVPAKPDDVKQDDAKQDDAKPDDAEPADAKPVEPHAAADEAFADGLAKLASDDLDGAISLFERHYSGKADVDESQERSDLAAIIERVERRLLDVGTRSTATEPRLTSRGCTNV